MSAAGRATAGLVLAAALAGAHEATRATLVVSPQRPRVDRPCRVDVSLRTASGLARFVQRAWIVAEMSGHPMPPVVAELKPAADGRDFTGELSFTMQGPWRVTLHVQDGSDVLLAPMEWQVVGADDDSGAAEIGHHVDLREPARDNVVPPGAGLAAAIGLAAAMQAAARFYQRRRQRAAAAGAASARATTREPYAGTPRS